MTSGDPEKPTVASQTSTGTFAHNATGTLGVAIDPSRPALAAAREAGDWISGEVVLGTYAVTALLGEGGMGRVYRARHLGWGVDLAIKSPRPEIVARDGGIEAFVREAKTWVTLGLHPHVVHCFYVRVIDGIPRVFAEYVEGGTLADWIRDGRFREGAPDAALVRILDVATQIAWGLDHAHAHGFVHQDVKPANVLMTPGGCAKVTDFGIAQAWESGGRGESPASSPERSALVPGSGVMTPGYCSPEQARGQALTPRTDVWSWALCVLQMFEGERTWRSGVAGADALRQHLTSNAATARGPAMPRGVADLLERCFAESPADRPQRAGDVVAALHAAHPLLQGRPPRQPDLEPLASAGVNNRALSLYDLDRRSEAEDAWRRALEMDPRHPEATYNLGLYLWRAGRLDPGDLKCRLDDLAAAHPEAAWLSGLFAAERGDHEAALACLRPFAHVPEVAAVITALETKAGDLFSAPWLASRVHSGRVLKTVAQNTFTIDRDLLAYQRLLGPVFMEYLSDLGPEQHWVDSGAGEALAIRDYLSAAEPSEKARVTAVSVIRPPGPALAEIEGRFPPPQFRYLAGKPIEERAAADIGGTDLITDVYGPLQYARQIDAVMGTYGRLLKPGGRLFAVLPAITFLEKDGTQAGLTDWLGSVRGFTAHQIPDPRSHLREVILERNEDAVEVPPLRLLRAVEGTPPMREFAL